MTTAFAIDLKSEKSVEEAVAAVDRELRARQFAILWDLDMRAKLAEKGIAGGPEFRVLEVCSAPRAKEALDEDLQVGYFLPCKVVVYRAEDGTHLGVLRPTAIMGLLPGTALQALAEEVEGVLGEAIAAAV